MLDTRATCSSSLVPYLVSSRHGSAAQPLRDDEARSAMVHVDPMRVESAAFLDRLQRLNAVIDGPAGRAMPRWVFYDCAEVPGGIAGLAAPGDRVAAPLRDVLGVEGRADELTPLSMLVAIPMLRAGWWQLFGLCATDQLVDPSDASLDLRARTLNAAAATLQMRGVVAASPWSAPTLKQLAAFAPLELVTAWTPAHDDPATATVSVNDASRLAKPPKPAAEPSGPIEWLDVADVAALRSIQERIEAGARLEVAGPPRARGPHRLYPIREVVT